MRASPRPRSCNSTPGQVATMSALRNHTENAHTRSHLHTEILTIPLWSFLGGAVDPRGKQLNTGPEPGSIPPSVRLFFLCLLLSHLSPSMSFYLHSRLFSLNSLPDRVRGAALLMRAQHQGPSGAACTQKTMVHYRMVCGYCSWFTQRRHNDSKGHI